MKVFTKTLITLASIGVLIQASPVLAQTASAGCDYTDASSYDGWGWNNATGQSCPPLASTTQAQPQVAASGCDYSAAGTSGWGWNPTTQQSCAPLSTTTQVQTTAPTNSSTPTCQLASDPDGDGWGWENNRTCRISNQAVITPTTTTGTSVCDDPDGDGWGWDGTGSCRVNANAAITPVITPVVTPVVPQPQTGECLDPDGDGYGWNGTSSCIATQINVQPQVVASTSDCTAPAPGSVFVSSNNPVRSTGNAFYPDRGPQCVGPNNQFDGPGLGYGDFLLINNAWNGDKSTYDWQQCIALSEANGVVQPSWTYDWGNEDDLQPGFREWEVKSYPEIIYGAKSNTTVSASCEETGLPVQVSNMPQIDISYSYRSTQSNNRFGDFGTAPVTGGDRNIALESFLHSSCDIKRGADSNREFELMVWLDVGPERRPSGRPPVSVYTDSFGRSYDVYVKGAADPGYIAYVAQQEQTSGNLNWNEFFADAQANAGSYGVNRVNDNWCLGNILLGTEIWWGEGSLSLDRYEITRSY